MSWFGSKKKYGSRRDQLDGLGKVKGARSNHDGSAWTIEVYTRLGVHKVFVDISPEFPTTPPRFRIDSRFTHRKADPSGSLMIAEIRSWTPASNLGSVANLIINEILAEPPKPAPIGGTGSPSARQSAKAAGMYRGGTGLVMGGARVGDPSAHAGRGAAPKPPAVLKRDDTDLSLITFPVPSDIFSIEEVKKLEDKEIRHLVKKDSAMQDLAFDCCHFLREMKRSSQDAVLDLAKQNVATKDEINEQDKNMAELREEIDTLGRLFEQLRSKQQQIFQRKFSTAGIVNAFDKRLAELDEEGYQLKQKLEDDEMTPVMYCRKLTALRTEYHLLSMKKEKYVELAHMRSQ